MNNQRTVARNAVWLIVQRVSMTVIAVFVTALVARYLGTDRYGMLVLMLTYIALFTPMSVLGTRPYSVRLMALQRDRAAGVVADMVTLRMLLSLLAMTAAGVFVWYHDPQLPRALVIAMLSQMFINTLANCFIDGLYGIENIKGVATVMATSGLVVQAGCALAVAGDLRLSGIAAAYVLGSLVMLVSAWRLFKRDAGALSLPLPSRALLRYVNESWMFFLQNAVTTLRSRIDVVLITRFLGNHEAGLYGASITLIQRVEFIHDGITTALFPRVAAVHSSSGDVGSIVRSTFKVAMVIALPMGLGLSMVADDVALLVFGEAFRESGLTLAILALVIPFHFTTGIMFNVLSALGQQASTFRISAAATVLACVMILGGILAGGLTGAAVGYLITHVVLAGWLTAAYWRQHGTPMLFRDALKILAANAVMVAVLYGLPDHRLALEIIVSIAVYAIAVPAMGIVNLAMVKAVMARPSAPGPTGDNDA